MSGGREGPTGGPGSLRRRRSSPPERLRQGRRGDDTRPPEGEDGGEPFLLAWSSSHGDRVLVGRTGTRVDGISLWSVYSTSSTPVPPCPSGWVRDVRGTRFPLTYDLSGKTF